MTPENIYCRCSQCTEQRLKGESQLSSANEAPFSVPPPVYNIPETVIIEVITPDSMVDIFTDYLTDQMDIAERVHKLLRNDRAGRTIADMADILNEDEQSIALSLALLTNFGGCVFATFPVAGEVCYAMVVSLSARWREQAVRAWGG